MELIFATNNAHKIKEIQRVVSKSFTIITLKEAGIDIDIPEPHATLKENAAEKSKVIYQLTGKNCFAEDTGLEVTALNGEPGVHSARYAGHNRSFEKNIEKLLFKLKDHSIYDAQFRTVIHLLLNKQEYFFEGICKGTIISELRGNNGFGYDPVFVPVGSDKTFAEMSLDEKNHYSHRRKATDKLVAFLNKLDRNL